ncbi:voltage-gated potassium channel [Sinobaca qinghaiensis]|uniref:Voltage-gated potassium channel n=1 Tax=Sinobaca qinghaiensis TaxID=342944 RepID=A0A419V516_9BACL|nr:potassium channel family protein [Sinobaca qinghaiensis]RKD73584.1 voltage-gated potassium channel [Sinobaca qinghaiensis]
MKTSRFHIVYESIMITLAVISLSVAWSANEWFIRIDFVVWLIFFIDVSIRFIKAPDKWLYIRKNPFDFIAIIPLSAIFQMARIARLLSALQRLWILRHYLRDFMGILQTNYLNRVFIAVSLLVILSSIPIRYLEPSIETYGDAVWWSIVTATTVGYGDISPETPAGRMIAIVLMIFGIGLIGMLTSSITTYFLSSKTKQTHSADVQHIINQLRRYEELEAVEVRRLRILLQELENDKQEKERPS